MRVNNEVGIADYLYFFFQAVFIQVSSLHKPHNWLGETIFFLIAWLKNVMLG